MADEGDASGGEVNACGGTGELKGPEGANDAKPNEPCGECGGRLACDGPERLACVGDRELNGCDTCGELSEPPGSACGECGYGRWTCAVGADGKKTGAMECVGDVGQNACGGCGLLDASRSPESECFNEAVMEQGTWQCVSRNRTDCITAGSNACGGGNSALTIEGGLAAGPGDAPFERCGACGDGFYICGDPNTLSCADESAVNSCGWCGVLRAVPGTPCGSCQGSWACDMERGDDVFCDQEINACGGCGELDAAPGEPCGASSEKGVQVTVCSALEKTECVVRGADNLPNACGGKAALAHEPQQPCGACGDGIYACISPNLTECVNVGPVNACGGCSSLVATPGTVCGQYSIGSYERWTCDGPDAVKCTNPSGMTNECGGVEVLLPKRRGGVCGLCGGGTNECAGGGLTCVDEVDTMTDRQHCGGCGMPCNSGEQCVAGLCEAGSDSYFVDVAAGMEHACALRANGVITCWGNGGSGRRGASLPSPPSSPWSPSDVAGVEDAVQIGLGRDFTCAVRSNGKVHCWGENKGGQLGHDTARQPRLDAANGEVTGVSNAIDLAVGLRAACAIEAASPGDSSGQVSCWGEGYEDNSGASSAQSYHLLVNTLATGTTSWMPRPITLPAAAIQVDIGNRLACAVTKGGGVYCWGRGALGSGPTWNPEEEASEEMPVQNIVVSGAVDVKVSDTAYYSHVCARLASGDVTCWGNSSFYQTGRLSGGTATQPISGLSNVVDLDVSEQSGCAVLDDGSAKCWGRPNEYGVLGNGGEKASSSALMLLPLIKADRPALDGTAAQLQGVEKVSLFEAHGMESQGQADFHYGARCVLVGVGAEAQVRCWGSPRGGAVGDGQQGAGPIRSRPHPVLGLEATPPVESGQCDDGIDNDLDSNTDLDDPNCAVQLGASLLTDIPVRDWGQYEAPSCFAQSNRGATIRAVWEAPSTGTYRFSRSPITSSSDVSGVMELLRTCDPATTGQCVAVQGECVDARGQSGQSVEADLSAGEKAYLLIQVYGTVRQNSRFVLEVEEVLP